jgi:serine/threonine protein kinase
MAASSLSSPPRTGISGRNNTNTNTGLFSPTNNSNASNNNINHYSVLDWIFPSSEVIVSDVVLGRGAFGEVRMGTWRNVSVACKRLHTLTDNNNTMNNNTGRNHGGSNNSNSHDMERLDSVGSSINNSVDFGMNNNNNSNSNNGIVGGVSADFLREVELLSQLRHPNLVLFLGIVVNGGAQTQTAGTYTQQALVQALQTQSPQLILTELMTCSLYDILETHKIRLQLPEILDMCTDIVCGLQYLHEHTPNAVIHSDINTKNILIGGNRAKIAGLGQAKWFPNALTNTPTLAMTTSNTHGIVPGAMAYTARVVFANNNCVGAFCDIMDIFSFGILCVHLCAGEYPRIDKRDSQLQLACSQVPVLAAMIQRCTHFVPTERPSARVIAADYLRTDVMSNDRYYPHAHRHTQSHAYTHPILCRQHLESTLQTHTSEIQTQLQANEKLLSIEATRWQNEHTRAVKAETELSALTLRYTQQEVVVTELTAEIQSQKNIIAALRTDKDALIQQTHNLLTEIVGLKETISNKYQVELASKDEQLTNTMLEALSLRTHIGTLESELANTHVALSEQVSTNEHTQQQLLAHMANNDELEERVEQTLNGWRVETDNKRKLADTIKKMSDSNGKLNAKILDLESEIKALNKQLSVYSALPAPEDIRTQFAEFQDEINTANKHIRSLQTDKHELEHRFSHAEESIATLTHKVHTLEHGTHTLQHSLQHTQSNLEDIQSKYHTQAEELAHTQSTLTHTQESLTHLQSVEQTLKQTIAELEQQAIVEAKRTQMLVAKAAAGAAELGLTQADYEREQALQNKHHHHHHHVPEHAAGEGGSSESKEREIELAAIELDEEE